MGVITTVVNVRYDRCTVYIGRGGKGQDGYFGNPYRIGRTCQHCGQLHDDGGSTLSCFSQYFYSRIVRETEFAQRVMELKGHKLGCFCRPKEGFKGKLMCHGQIIAGLLEGIDPRKIP